MESQQNDTHKNWFYKNKNVEYVYTHMKEVHFKAKCVCVCLSN